MSKLTKREIQLHDQAVGVAVATPEEILKTFAVGSWRDFIAKGLHLVSTFKISPI